MLKLLFDSRFIVADPWTQKAEAKPDYGSELIPQVELNQSHVTDLGVYSARVDPLSFRF
jgi:hypothetical protein